MLSFDLNSADIFSQLLEKDTIIVLAVTGAIIATVGSFLVNWGQKNNLVNIKLARFILRTGYAITWASILIFIVVGFIGSSTNVRN